MRHEITALNTKRMLADSLKKIMEKKAFSKITVTEIITDCGVNRKTFYYHFSDTYALLHWFLEQETTEVLKAFDLLVHANVAEQVKVLDLAVRADHCTHNHSDGLRHHTTGQKQARYWERVHVRLLVGAKELWFTPCSVSHITHLIQRFVQNVVA